MNTSLSKTLVICGTVLILSPWAGIVANTLAVGSVMAARSNIGSVSIGSGEPFGVACGIVGIVMIGFTCWKSRHSMPEEG